MAESGQIAVRPEGQSTCIHHKGKTLELFCEKCQDVLCAKCVSTVHKGHNMCDLCDVTSSITQDIRRFVADTEGTKLPKSQENIRCTIDELEKNSEYFDYLSAKAKTQADRMKEEIDIMTAETLSLYQQLKEENARLLTDYKRQLEEGYANLYNQQQECKRLLQTASAISILDARDKIKSFALQTLSKPTLRTASFEPTKSLRGLLEQAFGTRRTTEQSTSQAFLDFGQTLSLASKPRSDARNYHPLSYFSLLSDVKVLGQGELLKFSSTSLSCSSANEACVCFPLNRSR
ncbi:E3 ubiquitin-protein ligase TRIM71-like [Pecten maximus]|uniref:E3 ubiquitin-protein ligase TRIM71-like n=1 Tax=Pecten maximus TaxID=6579 RepID=UPI0014587C84|nr:E3 ubiquitin-protein ligase TRIM71-like [Pecten maximus]